VLSLYNREGPVDERQHQFLAAFSEPEWAKRLLGNSDAKDDILRLYAALRLAVSLSGAIFVEAAAQLV
jgi:hypothetical protein